jgi:hypothetical protein
MHVTTAGQRPAGPHHFRPSPGLEIPKPLRWRIDLQSFKGTQRPGESRVKPNHEPNTTKESLEFVRNCRFDCTTTNGTDITNCYLYTTVNILHPS